MTALLERYDEDTLRAILEDPTSPEDLVAFLAGELDAELHDWDLIARENQLPPEGDWLIWLLITGRRWGKTRTAAEWMRRRALSTVGVYGICAPTHADTRDVCVEGGTSKRPSGLLSVCRPGEIANYNRTHGEITFSNGSKLKMLSADEPDRARGWGFYSVWCDEFSSWRYAATWYETLLPATTMSDSHRFVITTTPKPNPLTRALLERAKTDPRVKLVRGHSSENAANLGLGAIDELRSQLTARLARQEIEGELLEDADGALWTQDLIDAQRLTLPDPANQYAKGFTRAVVAIDPAGTTGENSDETGIVAAAKTDSRWCPACGPVTETHAFVLADRSGRFSPDEWARRAIALYDEVEGDRIVAEDNFGKDMVEFTVRTVDHSVPFKRVHASKGKRVRAEPIAALYEQGRIHHVGPFDLLEPQLTTWEPDSGESPDRLDALVWALTDLMLGEEHRKMRFRGAA